MKCCHLKNNTNMNTIVDHFHKESTTTKTMLFSKFKIEERKSLKHNDSDSNDSNVQWWQQKQCTMATAVMSTSMWNEKNKKFLPDCCLQPLSSWNFRACTRNSVVAVFGTIDEWIDTLAIDLNLNFSEWYTFFVKRFN